MDMLKVVQHIMSVRNDYEYLCFMSGIRTGKGFWNFGQPLI